jgi:hypothetical protein
MTPEQQTRLRVFDLVNAFMGKHHPGCAFWITECSLPRVVVRYHRVLGKPGDRARRIQTIKTFLDIDLSENDRPVKPLLS